jgi:diguanylate cyclase (GGDEF)-like protein
VASAPKVVGDDDQLNQSVDQSAEDLDQTHSDADQAASDADQASSQDDQDLADREQRAADLDQEAADLSGQASNASAEAYAEARDARDATKRERGSTAAIRARTTGRRLTTASQRDEVARLRDLTAESRDQVADARDAAADARDQAAEGRERRALEDGQPADSFAALRHVRETAAALRRESKKEREIAAIDRVAAAADRQRAEDDRRYSGLDELTGVFRRGTGELALAHEVARARRSKRPLVVAMIDVDGLKPVNDRLGHAAGDELLRDVATAITSTMRSYDVTVRWGGDEFICVLSDVTYEVAEARLTETGRVLERLRPGSSITVGIATLLAEDDLDTIVARADAALYRAKAARQHP